MTTLAHRRSICRLLIGILVSTQLAITAFACSGKPGMRMVDPPAATAVAMGSDSVAAAATKGDGMDSTLPNLCVAHCQYGQQSVDTIAQPSVAVALLTTLYTLPPFGEGTAHAGPLAASTHPHAAADPPHAILHCCLRD
jgi:hypothetical protein